MTTKRSPFLMASVAAISLLAFQANAGFILTSIGTTGAGSSGAAVVNDRGEIIGEGSASVGGSPYIFSYENGRFRNLNVAVSNDFEVTAINDAGQIVGSTYTRVTNTISVSPINPIQPIVPIQPIIPPPPFNAISSDITAKVSDISLNTSNVVFVTPEPCLLVRGVPKILGLGTNGGYANGINDLGQIVGGYNFLVNGEPDTYPTVTHAFIYQNGLMTDLGSLGDVFAPSGATAINNRSEIVGFSQTGDGFSQHAFLYRHGVMTDLGTLGGYISEATAINDVGEIVGNSTTTTNEGMIHPFIYRNGQMEDLGTLGGSQPDTGVPYNFNTATAINNWGQVVGQSIATNGAPHAFLYSNGRMIDLNDLVKLTTTNGRAGFLSLTIATGINDWGKVVGDGFYWDGKLATNRAFLLQKMP